MGDMLDKADIQPWLKSSLFHDFVLPKVKYTFSILTFTKAQLVGLDALVRAFAKRFEWLKKSHCNAQIHAPKHLGGLGFIPFEVSAALIYAVPHLRRLFGNDDQVRCVESAAMMDAAEQLASDEHSAQDLLANPDMFAELARANNRISLDLITTLGVMHDGNVYMVLVNGILSLEGLPPPTSRYSTMLDRINGLKRKLWRNLHRRLHARWASLPLEGEVLRNSLDSKLAPQKVCAPHTQHPWRFTPSQRLFQLQIDSNNIPCGHNFKRWRFSGNEACLLCRTHNTTVCESTKHVMNACPQRLGTGMYNPRHDNAHQVLTRAVEKVMSTHVKATLTNCLPEADVYDGALRPDQTTFLRRANECHVVVGDVKCYFPSVGRDLAVHAENEAKYSCIADGYRAAYGSAEVVTLALPTAGPVLHSAVDAIRALGIPSKQSSTVLREMMVEIVKGNYRLSGTLTRARDLGFGPNRAAARV
jgi:hypothetical protein